eukprot:s227_g17.t3
MASTARLTTRSSTSSTATAPDTVTSTLPSTTSVLSLPPVTTRPRKPTRSTTSTSSSRASTTSISLSDDNETANTTTTSSTSVTIMHGCTLSDSRLSTCPRYMLSLERCTAACPESVPVGMFICIEGRMFGSSGCLQVEGNRHWRGLAWTDPPPSLQESLRRALALSLGTPPSDIVRLFVVSKMPEGVDPEQATSHSVEWEMEVRLSEEHGFLEVSSKLEAIADVSSLTATLFRNVLMGLSEVTLRWTELVMPPVEYNGSILNFTADQGEHSNVADTHDGNSESDNSALVSAVLLSLTAIPVVASILNFISEDARLRRQPPPAREGPVPADLPELQRVHRRSKVRGSRSAIRERPS